MNIVAYCDQRYEQATKRACGNGATVLTCPPIYGADLTQYAALFESADLVYFNLHAAPNHEAWYTTDEAQAVNHEELSALDLSNAVVYMINCYAGGGMLDVLKRMRPRAIIGGYGENIGSTTRMAGADVLGQWIRRGLALGLSPLAALYAGKARLMLSAQTQSVIDALHFEALYERGKYEQ